MKKIEVCILCAVMALVATSCGKKSYKSFVGTWGVERIEYYQVDDMGLPIANTTTTYTYVPGDKDNGIELIFRNNKTGEMRDSAIDTLWMNWNDSTQVYDSYIYCPDTTLVNKFTYSYDESESVLYMKMDYATTFSMTISNLTSDAFSYENEYGRDKETGNLLMEKADLKKIDSSTSKTTRSHSNGHPVKPGSLLGGRK